MPVLKSFLLLLIFSFSLTGQSVNIPDATALDALFNDFNHPDQPGVAVSVLYQGETVYEKGFGLASLTSRLPLTPETPLYAAELSGQFTAAALLLLVDQNKLSLNDPVHQYLPELVAYGDALKVRHLLNRSHGLHNPASIRMLQGRTAYGLTIDQILQLLVRQNKPAFAPGTKFVENDIGLTLIAEIISRVSGQSFSEFCADKLFVPLGLQHAFFVEAGQLPPEHVASAYENREGRYIADQPLAGAPGATGLYLSVKDWSQWEAHLRSPRPEWRSVLNRILPRASLDSGHQHSALAGELTLGQQFGHGERGIPKFYRTGIAAGYTSSVFRFLDQELAVIIMSNNGMVYNGHLGMNIAYLFLSDVFPEPAVVTIDPKDIYPATTTELESFVGLYWADEASVVREITLNNDTLFYNRGGQAQPLVPIGPGEFQLLTGYDDKIYLDFLTNTIPQTLHFSIGSSDPLEFTRYRQIAPDPASYAGSFYANAYNIGYDFKEQDGQLVAFSSLGEQINFTPYGKDKFYGDRHPWWSIEFSRDETGAVNGVTNNFEGLRGTWFQLIRPLGAKMPK